MNIKPNFVTDKCIFCNKVIQENESFEFISHTSFSGKKKMNFIHRKCYDYLINKANKAKVVGLCSERF